MSPTASATASRVLATLLSIILLAGAVPQAAAYKPEMRQKLTFSAARRFNRCVEGTDIPRLSALEVRNLVRGNVDEADRNVFRRTARWNYYDRARLEDRRLLWTIETRMHGRFSSIRSDMLAADGIRDMERYRYLGVLAHYLQSVSIPADVVPIFHPRPWRWPAGDRFSNYPVDEEALESAPDGLCAALLGTPDDETFETLLDGTAAQTMAAIRSPIADMQATWHAFWEEDEPGRFGSYGEAGNTFGRDARFRCGEERCLLLTGDPIYDEFARRQHELAVLATMRGVLLLQRFRMVRAVAPGTAAREAQ